jgi:hypothetical protein
MFSKEDFTRVNFGVFCLDTPTHEYIFQTPSYGDTVSYAAKRGNPVLLIKKKESSMEVIDVKDFDEAVNKINDIEETP